MDSYLVALKDSGLKLTPKRRAVIALFLKSGCHMGPSDVFRSLKKKISPLGLPTIYRILDELQRAGILVQTPSDDRQLSYALCRMPQEHHHHFVCRKCRKVEEVAYCNFGEISRLIRRKLGGQVERHTLYIEGLCVRCQ